MLTSTADDPAIEVSGQSFEGFELDDVFHAPSGADIHFGAYVPDAESTAGPHALFVTLPGWEGLYFQGVGENLHWERFAQEAAARDPGMVVLAPQLEDWGQASADQTIELIEHFIAGYDIDPSRVYIEGYSGGGETLSLVMGQQPELFAAALAVSSQWDGDLEAVAEARTPVRLFIGRDDSYYGSDPFVRANEELRGLYERAGLSQDEIDGLIVLDMKEADYFAIRGFSDQHGGGTAAATDADAMEWLFSR